MSDWLEISLNVDGESAEAIAELLQRYGHQGVSIEQEDIRPDYWDEDEVPEAQRLTIRAYLPIDENTEDAKLRLENALGHMRMMYPMPDPIYQLVKDEDWSELWKVHYQPLRIGRHLLICPEWIKLIPEADDIVITLDPGMAFGTGTHPTTQLCLEAIEDLTQTGEKVLDLGCGSGILAIAAAKLGAGSILAVDIDPVAVANTIENSERNQVEDLIIAQTGSLASLITSPRRFDFMLVNILAKIIIAMCDEQLGQLVRPGGKAIFSGILDEQVEDVEIALRKTGLEPYKRRQIGDWMLIEAIRPN
ncbi:50S ribosomal protein L11 methyltransferase [Anaerolineales bacterium]